MPSDDTRPQAPAPWRAVLTPAALSRLAVGWVVVLAFSLLSPLLAPPVPAPLLIGALAVIIGVILLCAFGVVHEAEALAHRLGDPYGTLILTLSIVVIEVVLIAAVMLGPGESATIARDSVMAVSMIILNLVVGVCLVVAGIRHGDVPVNRSGTTAYLALLVVLSATAFALPGMIGAEGSFTDGQAAAIIVLTVGLYAFFLWRQTGAQAEDFQEVPAGSPLRAATAPSSGASAPWSATDRAGHRTATAGSHSHAGADSQDGGGGAGSQDAPRPAIGEVIAEHRGELLARSALLVATVLPIVLLSQHMAALLDDGLGRLGAPVALAGVLIAMIVFTPETLTAIRAALGAEMQRVVNLSHGALVSTVGLTIPTVLVISLLTGQDVVLAESPANLLLLAATLAVSAITASSPRVSTIHGAAHLVLFAIYGLVLFS